MHHSEFDNLSNIKVNIINGKCPKTIQNIKVSNYYYTASDNEAMFSAEECGKMEILSL